MPYGAQKEVAVEEQCSEGYVSLVMSDDIRPKTEAGRKRLRSVQVAIARKLRLRVDDVFPPASPNAPAGAPAVAIPA
jgi:hypothetical protein